VEQENLQLVRWSIQPIAQRIEEALSDLLVRGQVARFNYDALLRTDTLTRYQAHQIALTNGFLSIDEVRAMEKREPIAEEPKELVPEPEESIDEIDDPNGNEEGEIVNE
jgi:phage portal protein BeeE